MTGLDEMLVALNFAGCEARRVDRARARWIAHCPACGQDDAVGVGWGFGGLAIFARCGCSRGTVLDVLGLGEVEPW